MSQRVVASSRLDLEQGSQRVSCTYVYLDPENPAGLVRDLMLSMMRSKLRPGLEEAFFDEHYLRTIEWTDEPAPWFNEDGSVKFKMRAKRASLVVRGEDLIHP